MTHHPVRHERWRSFQPPWYTVAIYTCPQADRDVLTLIQSWHGPTPNGGVRCPECGDVLPFVGGPR